MYWSDWSDAAPNGSVSYGGKIHTAWMDGGNRRILVSGNLYWPNGLSLDREERKLYWCDSYLLLIQRSELDGTKIEVNIHC